MAFRTVYVAALCLGMILAFYLPPNGLSWLWWAIVLLLLVGGGWAKYRFGLKIAFQAALCVALLVLGGTYSVLRTQIALNQQWLITDYPRSVDLRIAVIGLPERDNFGRTRFLAKVWTNDGKTHHILMRDFMVRDWDLGSVWRVRARVRAPIGLRNTAGFDSEAWALSQGIDGMASLSKERFRLPENEISLAIWLDSWRAHLSGKWQKTAEIAPDGAALMRALTIGDRGGLSSPMWAAFRPLGINHLISISGLHVTMFALLTSLILHNLFRIMGITPRSPRKVITIFSCLAAIIYTLLAGAQVPALRSLLMLLILAWFWWRNAWTDIWRAWWLAMMAVLLFQPMAVLSVGFWLSFGLVGVLMWLLIGRMSHQPSNWRVRYLEAAWGQVAVTLIGGMATVFLFGLLPVFSPLVNALAIPWFSWFLVPLGLLVSFLPFDTPLIWVAMLAQKTMDVLLNLGNWLPEIGFAQKPILLFWLAIISGLLLLLPLGSRIKPLATVAIFAFFMYQPPSVSGSLKVNVVDVGQGLAVLLQTSKQNVLFDTGTPAAEWALLPTLRAFGIKKLDKVVVSHHDNDHDGGLAAIQKTFTIDTLYAGQPEFYADAIDCRNQYWQQDGALFEMLTLPRSDVANDDNAQSCVLRVSFGKHTLLIMGDIDQQGEAALIKRFSGSLKSDVLILGHHGSRSASSNWFLQQVSPNHAIASSGFANHYRHPHPDVLSRLNARNIIIWRTDLQGRIEFEFNDKGVVFSSLLTPYWWQRKPFH